MNIVSLTLNNYKPESLEARLARRTQERKQARKKNRLPTSDPIAWLRSKTFSHVYGIKTPKGVRPSLTRARFWLNYNDRRSGNRLANYKYQDHFDGKQTFYYWSSPNKTAEYALAMIDIDNHKTGSLEGAWGLAEYLKTIFPGCYFEKSTNGNGLHGYLLIYKLGRSPEDVRAAFKHLQEYLKQEAQGFDIEGVEVKGQPPILTYDRDGNLAELPRYGQFAKLPRDVSRFNEWQQTTALTLEAVNGLAVQEQAPEKPKGKGQLPGSITGDNISREELDMMPSYEAFLLKHDLPTHAGRYRLTATDFAQALVLLRFFSKNMNPDGSLPQARIRGLWEALYEAGDFQTRWNNHRWKAVRDWFSSQGWIEWQSNRYFFFGDGKKGQACKWKLEDGFLARLDGMTASKQKAKTSFVVTARMGQGPGLPLVPVKVFNGIVFDPAWWLEAEKATESLYAA